jgi:hypothetical protein
MVCRSAHNPELSHDHVGNFLTMTYYTALINAWDLSSASSGALPTGVTGASLFGLTTAAKLTALNAWTVSGIVPTTLYATGNQLLNCMNWTEFAALTVTQQANLLMMCMIPGQLLGGSSNTAQMVDGMILAYFTNHSGPTVLALTALAQAAVTPWWQASVVSNGGGLNGPVNANDLAAAGGLT